MFRAFAFGIPGGCEQRRWGGGWSGFENFGSEFFGPRARGTGRRGRIFEQGDLKYVILRLLDEKPRHGYEVIKELEDRFGGAYSPSPGTVYPTLTMLEDIGYASAASDEGGRKVYSITDAGRAYLAEHSETVDSIFERIARFVEGIFDEPMMELNASMRRLGRAAYARATRDLSNAERVRRIREILDRAAAEIERLDEKPPR